MMSNQGEAPLLRRFWFRRPVGFRPLRPGMRGMSCRMVAM